jgi:hypothetical protein
MQPLRRLIRESINLAENVQLADKVYFNPGRLSSEVKRIVLHITGGDAYTKLISDMVYAMLQQDERSSDFLMLHLSDKEEKPVPKGGYDVSKSNLQLKDWQKIRAYHNQLKAYDKNVYPIIGLDINNQKDIWKLINALNQRSSILEYMKKLPSIAIRNMKEDIRKPRTSMELQYYRSDMEYFLKYYALLSNRTGKMKDAVDKKIFRSGINLQDLKSFVGGRKIDKKFVKQVVQENSGELKIVYDRGNIMIIDVTGEKGIKAIGCNSVWCFTYGEDSTAYRGPKTTWGANHTNGHVYVIIDLAQESDSPYLMYTLIKPLSDSEENHEKLVNMANQFEEEPFEILGDLMNLKDAQQIMNFGEHVKVDLNEVKKYIRNTLKVLSEDLISKIKNSSLGDFMDNDWKTIHKNLIINSDLDKDTTFDDMVFRNLMHGNRPSKQDLQIFDHLWSTIPELYDEKYKNYELFLNAVKNVWKSDYKTNISEGIEFLIERKSKFEKLEDNKIPLTDEERKKVMDADAVWHFSHLDKPSPAVWKSKDKKTGKITYVCHTHRAYQDRPTLKGAISIFHSFIKGTS